MRLTRWDSALTTGQSNEVLSSLANWHLREITTLRKQASEVLSLLEKKDYLGLCQYELSYEGDPSDVYHLRQALAFFQKRRDLDLGIDTAAVAWDKFVSAERLCEETNDIFRRYNSGRFSFLPDVESVLHRATARIAAILGDVPDLQELKLRFGPGATTALKKKDASARRKLSSAFACSGELATWVSTLLAEMPGWSDLSYDGPDSISQPIGIDPGRADFVRKSALTDRTIVVEPMLNSMVQLGVGDYIARRLLAEGVDTHDQTLNQRLARVGSLTNALATLDLSSASDTIACGLVESLLPLDWWLFLSSIRTGTVTTPGGERLRLQKFSSMGNGFTFPLETLIFYALAESCVDRVDRSKVSVYGDDIIVPSYAYPLLKDVLTACGFLLNPKKSYASGPFRESCGKDYYCGIDVRPCYVKDVLTGESVFVLHNFYVRNWLPGPAKLLLECIDESMVLWGPDGYGDGHLLGDFTPNPAHRESGWSGFTFETYSHKSNQAFYRLGADYVFPTYSIYMREGNHESDPLLRSVTNRLYSRLDPGFRTKVHGIARPERSDAVYSPFNGKVYLRDTLPGYRGYKRIKIYTLG